MTNQPSATRGGALRRGLAALGALLLSAGMATALAAQAQAASTSPTTTTTTTTTTSGVPDSAAVTLTKVWVGGVDGDAVTFEIVTGDGEDDVAEGSSTYSDDPAAISTTDATATVAVGQTFEIGEGPAEGNQIELDDYTTTLTCTDGTTSTTMGAEETDGGYWYLSMPDPAVPMSCTITNAYDPANAIVARAEWSNPQGGSAQLWFEWPNCNLDDSDHSCLWPLCDSTAPHCATEQVGVEAGQNDEPFAFYLMDQSTKAPDLNGLEIHQWLTDGGAYETPTALLSGLGAAGLTLTGPVCTTNNECVWTVHQSQPAETVLPTGEGPALFRSMPRAFIPGPTIHGLLVTVTNTGVRKTTPSSSTPTATTTSPAPTTSTLPTTSSTAVSTTSVQVLGVSQEESPSATEVIVPLASTGAPVLALGSLAALLLLAGSALLVIPAWRRRRSTHD